MYIVVMRLRQVGFWHGTGGLKVTVMQLHTGTEDFGNVIFRYSELPSQYHFDASIDVNRM
jgi:hypothetical protein